MTLILLNLVLKDDTLTDSQLSVGRSGGEDKCKPSDRLLYEETALTIPCSLSHHGPICAKHSLYCPLHLPSLPQKRAVCKDTPQQWAVKSAETVAPQNPGFSPLTVLVWHSTADGISPIRNKCLLVLTLSTLLNSKMGFDHFLKWAQQDFIGSPWPNPQIKVDQWKPSGGIPPSSGNQV